VSEDLHESKTTESSAAIAQGSVVTVFPKLPVLEALINDVQQTDRTPLAGLRLVCVQHLLETTGSLLESFVRLGCRPDHIHVLGKFYSTSRTVEADLKAAGFDIVEWQGPVRPGGFPAAIRRNIARLWSRAELQAGHDDSDVLILDDGGRCRQHCPAAFRSGRVVGVEQTTSGLKKRHSGQWIPTVEVAGSAAKRTLEPPAVTASVMQYVVRQLGGAAAGSRIGVVGLGTVGEDLARRLAVRGFTVNVCDKNAELRRVVKEAHWCGSLRALFASSDYILGCTGEDILADADWVNAIRGDKMMASCSSEDVEFRSLLRRPEGTRSPLDALRPVEIKLAKGSLKILRGGFPANFTGTRNSGPVPLIQVTRGLLLAGVLQAARLRLCEQSRVPRRIMLDPKLQLLIAKTFLPPKRRMDFSASTCNGVFDTDWLAGNSTGRLVS
jgi:S-adenosylhomocysteine hydrolase